MIFINQNIFIQKSGGLEPPRKSSSVPNADALAKINQYTRREFKPEELYTFPVALCDNEVDRDGERFTINALQKLAELFPGKTGVFDHNPQAKNQTARIFSCRVERDETRLTSYGEPYARLVAQAYLPRTGANKDFITELESGIKKEVSVGCAVQSVTCSVCGADLKSGCCEHQRGQSYGGVLCCAVLDNPTDAYEWSFVAVPAQREAGVLKSFGSETSRSILKSLRESGGETVLNSAQASALLAEFDRLGQDAACGRDYRDSLKKDFVRFGALAQPGIPAESLSRAADAMSMQDLKSWCAAFQKQAEKAVPLRPQLAWNHQTPKLNGNEPFQI
ncbi:MAG TPA: hypothetical protein VHP31_08500 [Caproicibacter sp.]|nr:hypothetical protein [Caproicibacter sp.]